MLMRTAKIALGLLLVPFCLGFTWQLAATLVSAPYKAEAPYYFLAGGLAYLTVHLLFKKPVFAYVLGHELTHALFALLSGGSVRSLQASGRGGRVTVSKSNFLITLAPYFFPLYSFSALVLYGAARAAGAGQAAMNTLIFLGGSAFTFHLALTLLFLRTDQSDIREQGAVFSYPLIYVFNLFFAALLVDVYLAENMDYPAFLAGGIIKTAGMIAAVGGKAYAFMR
jgi:hypothetical protein